MLGIEKDNIQNGNLYFIEHYGNVDAGTRFALQNYM